MSLELTIFNQTWTTLVWSRCEIKIGRTVIERATLAGFGLNRESTDYGQVDAVTGELRLRAVDEPRGRIEIGQVLEVKQYGKTEWKKARVIGRFTQGDVTRLTLEAEHE
jgi:hypothetical protein